MKFLPMKIFGFLCVLCVLGGESLCFSLDREAFSITNYDLNLQIEPEQHRLGARGKITLRNDTASPQKIAVLQISSSLDWRSVKAGEKAVQFVRQPYTSDIDHTGSLSEAIVTLPQEVAPHATIDLNIGYEGVVLPDATRFTRIGTPEDVAKNSDWDRIDENFTGLRGAGYVAWYPIATDVANLSEGDSLFEVLARWKAREAGSTMHLGIAFSPPSSWLRFPVDEKGLAELVKDEPKPLFNAVDCTLKGGIHGIEGPLFFDCSSQPLRQDAPTLVIAQYQVLEKPRIELRYLKGHEAPTNAMADAAQQVGPLITGWFGAQRERAKVAELPDPDAAPFESGVLLLTPLKDKDFSSGLTAAHQLTHASFLSFRPWIEEGLAHFAQTLYLEQQKGRQAAVDYMRLHSTALAQIEPTTTALDSEQERARSLVNTFSEELYRSKAMCVWWMLRDMIGDAALKKAIAAYKPEEDKDPSYMQRVVAAQTPRDLQWFFDDWVYHDRGLPHFKVESAFASKTSTNGYMLTITLDNLGTAGAEVPVTIKLANGEVAKRIEVRAKSKTTVRVETPAAPQEIRVNDGSVPETNPSNSVFKVEPIVSTK